MEFYDNFIALCNKIGKTPSAAAIEIGLAKPTVNRWKNGSVPTDATLRKVADYFGVPTDQLLGEVALQDFTVLMLEREGKISPAQSALLLGERQNKKPATVNGSELSAKDIEIINRVMKLSDSQKDALEVLLQAIEGK